MTVRAGEIGLGGFAAGTVNELECIGIGFGGEVPLGPAHETDNHRRDVERSLGQSVLVPVGVGAVADALEHSVGHELSQAIGENVARDAETSLHLAVAADPEERLAQEQEGPAIAQEDVDGELDGVARRPRRNLVPEWQLVRDPLWIVSETGFLVQPYLPDPPERKERTRMPPTDVETANPQEPSLPSAHDALPHREK